MSVTDPAGNMYWNRYDDDANPVSLRSRDERPSIVRGPSSFKFACGRFEGSTDRLPSHGTWPVSGEDLPLK